MAWFLAVVTDYIGISGRRGAMGRFMIFVVGSSLGVMVGEKS